MEFIKPWQFHALADLEYPYILDVDFISGSKVVLDFDRKSLVIQDSRVEDKKVDQRNLSIDISETKLNVVANVSDKNPIESTTETSRNITARVIEHDTSGDIYYTGMQNLSNNVKFSREIAMKLQKRRSGDQYSEHIKIGTQFYPSNIKERHRYGGPGVLVWGSILLNGRTELHIFHRGLVTGDRYCEEVLLPHVRLFRGAIVLDFIFMDDNARPHRTLAVEELLESEDITRIDWPAYSPDLNPIEHVWDALGRCIAARLHHLENTKQLKQLLIEEWALLPQEMLHQLDLGMRRRCEATIAVRGGDIPYYGTSDCCSSCWMDNNESRYYAFNKACFCLIPYLNRSRTIRYQSGPEEEELNRTDPTIRSQDANSSQQARVVRRPRENGQAVKIPEVEEPSNNSARK
ncbi:transposable element Tc3 transposase [Trichonephila clavipes]|nr:transposable element Tc3 transposase [Trichonephila clavipes]